MSGANQNGLNSQSAIDVAAGLAQRWNKPDCDYTTSPFLPLKQLSSRSKGAEMEHIFQTIMEAQGYTVTAPTSSDHDRIVDGNRIEVKGSFRWVGSGFRWQQIRIDQDYDYLVVLAFYPDRVELHACTHADALKHLQQQDVDGNWTHNQHGGKTVNSGAYFIDGEPEDFPWLRPLAEVLPPPSSK